MIKREDLKNVIKIRILLTRIFTKTIILCNTYNILILYYSLHIY